jgi:hypothetical protein
LIELAVKCSSYTVKENNDPITTAFADAADLLASLPATVLSSDESEPETNIAFVETSPWRNARMTQMIVSLTTYKQFAQQVSVSRKPGNRGYVCRRHHQRHLVSTTVPRFISSSLYDPTWYKNLDDDEQESLDVRSAVTVPIIVSLIHGSSTSSGSQLRRRLIRMVIPVSSRTDARSG